MLLSSHLLTYLPVYCRDGQVLCHLMNKLQPGIISKINTTGASFKMMENINK